MLGEIFLAPSAGFEPALMAPEATALSPELRGQVRECTSFKRTLHNEKLIGPKDKSLRAWPVSAVQSGDVPLAIKLRDTNADL